VRVCLMIEGQEGVTWERWVALAAACEEHGLEGLFRSDHYLSMRAPKERGALDAWATLNALSGHTSRIRLGTLVSPVTFRHPAELAKAVVVADHASDGRIELGIGAGWFEDEHRAYGFPFPPVSTRMAMLAEQIEIVHRMWDQDEGDLTFQGRHYQLEGCPGLPKPLQDPHPNLILGGQGGPKSLTLAARWADEYNVNFIPPDRCREVFEGLAQACEGQGRDLAEMTFSLMTNLLIGEDERDLEAKAGLLLHRRGDDTDPRIWLNALGPERIAGTPDRVLAQLEAFARAGVHRVMLQHLNHDDLESVALIGHAIVQEAASF
jgi:F420-dependent oxidoreductase-like protein